MKTKIFLALILPVLTVGSLLAQGSAEDYLRARSLRSKANEKRNVGRLDANWVGPDQFWYLGNSWTDNPVLVLVDGKQKTKSRLFDHVTLASQLSTLTKTKVEPNQLKLKIESFDVANSVVFLRANGQDWKCKYSVAPDRSVKLQVSVMEDSDSIPYVNQKSSGIEELTRFERSEQSSAETSLQFINQRSTPITISWIGLDGRRQSYGKIQPGATHDQHTFATHVWLISDENNRPLMLFRATKQAGRVIVTDNSRTQIQDNRSRRRGGDQQNRAISPDQKSRASIQNHNLVIIDRNDNSEFQLTESGTQDDPFRTRYYWSPDSKFVVVLQETNPPRHLVNIVESSPRDQVQPKLISYDYYKPGDKIPVARPRLFDVENRKQVELDEKLFENAYQIRNIHWQADSSRFTFFYNQRGHQTLRILAVDNSGTVKPIVDEASKTFVDYQGKFFSRVIASTNELIWMSERDGWNHLYLYDTIDGTVKNQITNGNWVVRGIDRVDEEQRMIWFRAGGVIAEQDPYYIHHCRISFDGTGLVVLTSGDGTHEIEYSPNGKYLIDSYSRVDQPPIHELRSAENGSLVLPLEETTWTQASILSELAKPTPFVAKGRDDKTDIYGVIFRPSSFDPKKSYPLLENIYAGPHGSHVPKSFSNNHRSQRMAELGFIVVQIDGMGTSNRSKAFHDVCWKNLADSGFPDRIRWIKAAAKTFPQMDISNVGIYGGSAGGQSTVAGMLQFGEFYKVGVADCGCHDNRMDKIWWNELWMGWPVGPHYEANSNVTMAKNLTGKLLLIVGELDRNVDPASTMQVVNALVKADRDFEMLVIPGAGHGAAGTPYGRRRMQDFFVKNILEVEPRWTKPGND